MSYTKDAMRLKIYFILNLRMDYPWICGRYILSVSCMTANLSCICLSTCLMFIKQIQYIFVVIYGPPCTVDSSCIPQPLEMKKEERKDEYDSTKLDLEKLKI